MSQFPTLLKVRQFELPSQTRFSAHHRKTINTVGAVQSNPISTPTLLIQPSFQHFRGMLTPQIKFGSHQLVEKEHTTTLHPDHFISPDMVIKTLRSLYFQTLYKREENDPSHLKLNLGPSLESNNALSMGLAMNLIFLDRAVDTIVSAFAGPSTVPTIMMSRLYDGHKLTKAPTKTTGKAFMYPQAQFKLGPVNTVAGGGENQVVQASRKISNSHMGKRLAIFMHATGATDIKKAHKDLSSAKEFNALEALAYEKYGLIDGIPIGREYVLTRANLEKFYKESGFYDDKNPEVIERRKSQFNKNIHNINKIDPKFLIPIRVFSPNSMATKQVHLNRPSLFHSIHTPNSNNKSPLSIAGMYLGHYGSGIESQQADRDYEIKDGLFDPIYKPRHLDSKIDASYLGPIQINIAGAKNGSCLIDDDLIYYGDNFTFSSADYVVESMRALKEKKLLQAKQEKQPPTNIKLILDSSGGDVTGMQKILQELDSDTQIKTDIILNGRAYSCGAFLVAAATGNRLATPISEIMLHNVSIGGRYSSNEEANQEAENMHQLNKNIIHSVAKSSGKPEKEVELDFLKTTYMNALDGLFYGKNRLLDGILVGPRQVITQEDVMEFLTTDPEAQAEIAEEVRFFENKGSDPNFDAENPPEKLVQKYLAHRWENFHDRAAIEPGKKNSLFDDPLNTIMKIASKKGASHDMDNKEQFKNTLRRFPENNSAQNREIAHFIIPLTPPTVRR